MVTGQRLTAVASLAVLQVFTVVAGFGLAVTGALRSGEAAESLVWPTVSARRPVLTAASASGTAGSEQPERAEQVAAAVEGYLASPSLGGGVAAAVADPRTGNVLFSRRADVPATPASTTKIATAVAALSSLGPDHRLTTRVVRASSSSSPVVLVGGGDPTLASPEGAMAMGYPQPAELATLAKSTARALTKAGVLATRVAYDDSLFTGPRTAPGWASNYVPEGSVAPITALSVDGGRVDPLGRARMSDPSLAAAESFADHLERQGIAVRGSVVQEPATAQATELAAVRSPSLAALVERMLVESDNELAEALARQVAIERGRPASFDGAAAAVREALTELGVAPGVQLSDGSGLSTENRMTASALVGLLTFAASPDHPEMSSIRSGLPVAGFSGTLEDRYGDSRSRTGAGVVRAKTGTLDGVSSLAGLVYAADGRLLVFAFLADQVPAGGTFGAEDALDRLAAALAECCG